MNAYRFSIAPLLALIMIGCADVVGTVPTGHEKPAEIPRNFPAVIAPDDNPFTPRKAELGRYLFHDKRLSGDYSVSCASCHQQEHGFSDGGNAVSRGFEGRAGARNAMSLTNVAYNRSYFWDGGVATLEQQALAPIIHPAEMNMRTDTLMARLAAEPIYAALFRSAWGDTGITIDRVTKSIATFERRLVSGDAPFDAWLRGDSTAISGSAARGYGLFFGEKGDCFHCHASFNFTDNSFRSNGLRPSGSDEGRYALTGNERDRGKFRVPTLRNIAVTAPYMHDGSFRTLQEVVRHYADGAALHQNQDPLIRPLDLSADDERDLIEFLESLTDRKFLADTTLGNPWK